MAPENKNTFIAATGYELIRFTGPDALEFLQALTTNDMAALENPGHTVMTGFCAPQGRLLGLLRVWGSGETICARVPPGMAGALLPRLKMFVLRSEVEIEGPVGGFHFSGVAGPEAGAFLKQAGIPAPERAGTSETDGDRTVLRTGDARFEIALPVEGFEALGDALNSTNIALLGPEAWGGYEIAAGIPEIYPATMDQFIPQMVNLDKLDVVSFSKGCYPGQEIIARIYSRGSVKRHMHVARADRDERIEPGTDVIDPEGKVIGTVVRSAPVSEGDRGQTMLAVIADSAMDSDLMLPDQISVTIRQPD